MSSEHGHRQLGGYKATLHNPNTSLEAKAHAAQVLTEAGVDLSNDPTVSTFKASASTIDGYHTHTTHDGHAHPHDGHSHNHADGGEEMKHEHHVLGGYKATLSNPNTSEQAKEHAEKVLKEGTEHEHHVLGGYKATLHNPNTSEGAKEHAKEVLREHGAPVA
ncbi:uncharacterized protein L199_004073 [Kwoniella botswanensis]|uniref:uncharacterized protein n=1 Tax=Kwoniella botswanensis TaxID=1268659 RepID=UPI00315C6BB1